MIQIEEFHKKKIVGAVPWHKYVPSSICIMSLFFTVLQFIFPALCQVSNASAMCSLLLCKV